MKKLVAILSLAAVCSAVSAIAQDHNDDHDHFGQGRIKHVLLISVDGMHAVDFANCANGISTVNNGQPYCPALAGLSKTGINYVAANTSKPSDSFPGLTAIITGGSPALTGVYYDVAYSRNYNVPAKTTGNGVQAGPCTANTTPTAGAWKIRAARHSNRCIVGRAEIRIALRAGSEGELKIALQVRMNHLQHAHATIKLHRNGLRGRLASIR